MLSEEQLCGMITNADRQLLWDIRDLLREVLVVLNKQPQPQAVEPVQPAREATGETKRPTKQAGKGKQYICKTCGEVYGNAGKMLACARKHKKEAEANADKGTI